MTWLTWRQLRTQAVATGVLLAGVVVVLLLGRRAIADLYVTSGLADCAATRCPSDVLDQFVRRVQGGLGGTARALGLAACYLLPGVIGAFWGAPLVGRELETGTFRLAWTQSVSRTRWLAVKVANLGATAAALALLLVTAVSFSASRLDQVQANRITPVVFGARGVVPVAYTVLAFAVGVLAGAVLRRTVAAMAVTFVVVAAVQLAVPAWLRAHLVAPLVSDTALDVGADRQVELSMSHSGAELWVRTNPHLPGSWILSNVTQTSAGAPFTGPADPRYCDRSIDPQRCLDWIGTLHLRAVVEYQPASRFWTLQWLEAGVLLAAAALALAGAFWVVRRRLS